MADFGELEMDEFRPVLTQRRYQTMRGFGGWPDRPNHCDHRDEL